MPWRRKIPQPVAGKRVSRETAETTGSLPRVAANNAGQKTARNPATNRNCNARLPRDDPQIRSEDHMVDVAT